MERMWSPWRSKYIESLSVKNNTSCVFCNAKYDDITNDESLVLYKGQYSFLIMNLYPYNNGHLMVVPYKHVSDICELNDDEMLEVTQLLKLSKQALTKVLNPEGFNIGANIGKCSGAGIDQHIHFHIVPRWNGDTNFMPVLGEVKIISQELLATKNNLIRAIKELHNN